ncbi:MAG: hypothetical protein PHC46_02655, partial [Clostridia bacterium]|nr:hypothetical protein [Clostridia bacterium]
KVNREDIELVHGINTKVLSNNKSEINGYDTVKVVNDKSRYLEQGISKGMIGVVMEVNNFSNECLVDFEDVEKNFYACISILGKDLETIKN